MRNEDPVTPPTAGEPRTRVLVEAVEEMWVFIEFSHDRVGNAVLLRPGDRLTLECALPAQPEKQEEIKLVEYLCHVVCPHCSGPRDTEGDKVSDVVYCVWCHKAFGFQSEGGTNA